MKRYFMLAAVVAAIAMGTARGEQTPAVSSGSGQTTVAAASVRAKLLADKALLFFVPFDFSVDAQFANHNKEGALNGDGTYVPGVVKNCLSLPAEGTPSVSYNIPDNIDLKRGTLMFWFKPGWWGDDKGQYTLLWVYLKNGNFFAFHRSFDKNSPTSLYVVTNRWNGGCQVGTSDFIKKDKWVHIATTWDATTNTFVFYANGKELSKSTWADNTQDENFAPLTLVLGRFYGNDTPINACYDEFFILKRALSADEVKTYVTETMPKEE